MDTSYKREGRKREYKKESNRGRGREYEMERKRET